MRRLRLVGLVMVGGVESAEKDGEYLIGSQRTSDETGNSKMRRLEEAQWERGS